jgi:hypothetical protein
MQGETVTQNLARGIGRVVPGKGYARIMAGRRTLAYVNRRRAGIQLDFRTAAVTDAPAKARKRAIIKGDRALLTLNGPNEATRKGRVEAARALLQHVAQKDQS